jgi:hypothetical protein
MCCDWPRAFSFLASLLLHVPLLLPCSYTAFNVFSFLCTNCSNEGGLSNQADEQPERVILYTDIEQYLCPLSLQTQGETVMLLLQTLGVFVMKGPALNGTCPQR